MNPRFTRLQERTHGAKGRFVAVVAMLVTMLALTGSAAWAQLLLEENFPYAAGSLLTANGWIASSGGGTNAQATSAPSLSYSGYASSGIGNGVGMTTSGEDDYRSFTGVSSGNVYLSALVNVSASQTAGDYFLHFNATPITSAFQGRVFVRKDPSSTNFEFGIQYGSAGVVYAPAFTYTAGTTYLVVVKYSFIAGLANDRVDLFVNPVVGDAEPTPTLTHINTGTDATIIQAVQLRQGSATAAPTVRVDGIRVGTQWSQVVSGVAYRSAGNGNWNSNATWQSSSDYSTYAAATATPDNTSGGIAIQAGHTVTVTAPVSADQVTVAATGNVTVGGGQTLTVTDALGSTDLTVNGTLQLAGTIAGTGSIAINGGTLQIDAGGWPGNTNTYSYDTTGLLRFNSGGNYDVNADAVWWPTSSGPREVDVVNGTLSMNVARIVDGHVTTGAGIQGSNSLGINGFLQLNPGGYCATSPTYGPASTLVYNTGGSYGIYNEWSGNGAQPGTPANITIQAGTNVTFDGNASSSARTGTGTLILTNGSLTLGSNPGGDLNIGGNWTNNAAFIANGRQVSFNGSTPQTITNGETFAYLNINNAAGVSAGGSLTITNNLSFTNGKLNAGASTIILPTGATVSGAGAGKYVNGKLQKHVTISAGAGSGSWEVGDASTYAPVAFSTTNGLTNLDIVASTTAGDHAQIAGATLNPSKSVNRTWSLSHAGGQSFGPSSLTFTFDPADLDAGTSTAALIGAQYDSPNWTYPTVGTRTSTSTQLTGISNFSDFQLAEAGGYTITATAGANGSISPNGAVSVSAGANQTFNMMPNTNYHVLDVKVDGGSVGAVSSYTFTNVQASHTIDVQFAIDTYTINSSAGAGGSIAPNGSTSVNAGDSQAYTISANVGYHIVDVVVDGGSQGPVAAYTFTNVLANHTIAASFAIDQFTITATAGANGSITPSGPVTVNYGDNQSFTITPDGGYNILDVTVDGGSVGPVASYTFTNVTANHTIHATFASTIYTITATAGANGSIAPSGAVNVPGGSDQTFTITPNGGYSIQDVTVDGSSVGAVASYTFTNVQANHTIDAQFQIQNYTLNVTVVGNGSVAVSPPTGPYPAGSSVTLTATAGAGSHFDVWSGDASGHPSPITITMDANKSITATFLTNLYSWNVTTGSASFATGTNWTPTRWSNSTDDLLQFKAGGSSIATGVTKQSIAQLFVNNNTAVALQAATATDTLRILGGVGTDLNVGAGSTLTLSGATATIIQVGFGSSATAQIDGNLNALGGNHRVLPLVTPCITFTNGSIVDVGTGFAGNLFGTTQLNSVIFQSGAFYRQASGSNPFGAAAPNAVAIFQTGSRYVLTGTITPSMSGRTYADVEFNPPAGFAVAPNGGNTFSCDNVFVTSGNIRWGMTGVFNLKGNILVSSGAILNFVPLATPTAPVSLSGSAAQTITVMPGGVLTDSTNETIEVKNAAGINLASDVTLPGTFKFTTGNVNTGANTLAITGTLTGASQATGWVNGKLLRPETVSGGEATRLFDIGDATTYTPTTVAVHTAAASFNLTASTTTGEHPNIGTSGLDAAKDVNRYYTLKPTGSPTFGTYDATFNYAAADVDGGANTAAFEVKRYDGASWDGSTPGTRTATSTQATGFTAFSDFAIGEAALTSYTIVSTAGPGGSIAPSGSTSVPAETDQTYTITPDACYAIADVTVDGVSVGAVSSYTFVSVTQNHTIDATFTSIAATTTTLSSTPNPSVCQQDITLKATITPSSAAGSVEFFNGATSLGTASVSGGVATLLVSGGLSVGAHSLTAAFTPSDCSLASTSPAVPQTVNKATPTVTLTSDVNPSVWNQPVTFTATLPAGATGTVTFKDSTTTLGTVPVSGGQAQITKSNLFVGNHTQITAAYSGDGCYLAKTSAPYAQLVNHAPTTVTVSSDINPSTYGQTVKFTGTVTPIGATNRVYFYSDGNLIGSAAVNSSTGLATLNVSNLLPGKHDITANYSGDGHYESSTSGVYSQQVDAGPSSVALSASPNPAVCQQPVTLTATLTPSDATGTVEFFDGASSLGTSAISGGTATLVAQFNTGSHSLTAQYSGDVNYTPSTSPAFVETVNKAPVTSVTVTSDVNPSVWNQPVTFTATVVPATATGTITFKDSLTVIGTAPLSGGQAQITKSNLFVGNHTQITATYSGDACYLAKTSPAYSQEVDRAPSTVSVSSDINPSTYGQNVKFTATVTPIGATNRVYFYSDGNLMGSAAVNSTTGLATLNVSNLLPGKHDITGNYQGDQHYEPSASGVYSQTVEYVTSSVTLTSDVNPSKEGASVTLTATVSPSDATGTVEFFNGASSLGSSAVSGGVATLTTTTLPAGTLTLTAHYSGDIVNGPSVSPDYIQEVTPDSPPQVTVVFPNGGENEFVGGTVKLVWNATDNTSVESVTLEISRDYGSTWETIALDIPNSGSYVWTVTGPGTNTTTSPVYSALFRVTAKDNAGVTGQDQSDGYFSIYDAVVPAVITSLGAETIDLGIRVHWALAAQAQFTSITLERSAGETGPWAMIDAAISESNGETVADDHTAQAGQTYWYRLVGTTATGQTATFGPVQGTAGAPREFALSAAWPNPSRGPVTMDFSVAKSAHVTLDVVDLQGRQVSVLADREFSAGRYQLKWDGRSDRGQVPAGVYFVRFITGEKKLVSRVTIAH